MTGRWNWRGQGASLHMDDQGIDVPDVLPVPGTGRFSRVRSKHALNADATDSEFLVGFRQHNTSCPC